MPDQKSDQSKTGEANTWCLAAEYVKVVGLGGAVAVVAFTLCVRALGFTAAGVAAGSIAACIQSAVYGGAVASTSVFAALQSVGAIGMGVAAKLGLFSAGAAVAAYIKNMFFPCVEGPKCSSDKE